MNTKLLRKMRIAALCVATALQACGGGDGGDSSTQPSQPSAPSTPSPTTPPPPLPSTSTSGLDPSFSSLGEATLQGFGGDRSGMALQADGKIVVVGSSVFKSATEFIVARYDSNGTLDASFGTAGTLEIDFFNFGNAGENVLVQADGKIVVGGLARNDVDGYGVARILP